MLICWGQQKAEILPFCLWHPAGASSGQLLDVLREGVWARSILVLQDLEDEVEIVGPISKSDKPSLRTAVSIA